MAVAPGPEDGTDHEVVASIDGGDERPEYVIADIATEEAWVAIDADAAPGLDEMR